RVDDERVESVLPQSARRVGRQAGNVRLVQLFELFCIHRSILPALCSRGMTDEDEVLAANAAFYRAFAGADAGAMDGVRARRGPGGPPRSGAGPATYGAELTPPRVS